MYPVMSSAAALSSAQCKEALLSRVILEFQLEILKTSMEFACSSDANNQPWMLLVKKLSTFFIFQSISMAIQQGNAVCVMGWPKNISTGLEGLFNFQVHEAEELW